MKIAHAFLMLGIVCIWISSTWAQTASGPKSGEKLPELKVLAVTGDSAGKEIDMAAERKEGPAIFIFVAADKFDRPTARFMRELDQELIKQDRRDVQIVAVWLTDDVNATKEYLPKAQQSLQLSQTTWTVFPGDRTGPQAWGIDSDRLVTVVVSQDGRARESNGYDSINETVVPRILERVKEKK